MTQTFLCDLCLQEIPFADRCRDETIFESGWAICAHCEPDLRQRFALSMARSQSHAGQQVNERLVRPGLVLEYSALARSAFAKPQYITPSLEAQGKQCLPQNERTWTFPHIAGSGYQPSKKSRCRI